MKTIFAFLLFTIVNIGNVGAGGLTYSGAKGTQHNRPKNDSIFYTTHSNLPHLPFLSGFVGTHGTYRFLTVSEQTFMMVGDGKHGLWRVQESGFVREYRKKGRIGLPPNIDPNSPNTLQNGRYGDIIRQNYAAFIPEEGFSGYKYPDQKISDGSDGYKGYQNFIDITIYHEKYGGKYEKHEQIDLPHYYCTMSQDEFPHVAKAWDTIKAQPNADRFGPLARRAGFDIKEHFHHVVRLNLFDDASLWANVGVGDINKDKKFKTKAEFKTHFQSVNFKMVDLEKMDYEIYLVERPFFNKPYLFITLIMENKNKQVPSTYIRPDGHYWDKVKTKFNVTGWNHEEPHFPEYPVKNNGNSSFKKTRGLPVYALHNPHRRAFQLSGGACPERGGDFASYPFGNPGAGWPTNYEEVGPICDGVVMDVKVWANMDKKWDQEDMFLANAAFDSNKVDYIVDPNIYGEYTDPYLINLGKPNPHRVDYTDDGKHAEAPKDGKAPTPVQFSLDFGKPGKHLDFNNVSAIHDVEVTLPDNGKQSKCDEGTQEVKDSTNCMDEDTMLALLIVILVLVAIMSIENVCLCVYVMNRRADADDTATTSERRPQAARVEMGVDNPNNVK